MHPRLLDSIGRISHQFCSTLKIFNLLELARERIHDVDYHYNHTVEKCTNLTVWNLINHSNNSLANQEAHA